jgi:uncharacterized membrane protein
MTNLIIAAAGFIAIHLLVSGTRVRDALTGRIGQGPYMGLFSVASIGLLVWTGFAYATANHSADNAVFWTATPVTRIVQLVVTFIAFLLIVPGLLTANPTSVRQEGALDRPDTVRGMLRITRHPFLWGVALWAAGHLLVNGDLAAFILFGSLLLLAVFGTYSIDAKRKRVLGDKWDAFAAQTSNVPFAAIAARRQSLALALGEVGWRFLVAIAVWAALVFAHPWMFGVRALP